MKNGLNSFKSVVGDMGNALINLGSIGIKCNAEIEQSMSTLKDSAKSLVGEVFAPISDVLKNTVLPMALGYIETLSTAFREKGITGLISAMEDIANTINTSTASNLSIIDASAIAMFTTFINGILTMLPSLLEVGLSLIINLALSITEALPQLIPTAINTIQTLVNILIENLPLIINVGIQLITELINGILLMLPSLLELGVSLIVNLALGITEALPQLVPTVIDTILTLVNTLIENLPLIIDAGVQLVVGLIQGIINSIPVLVEKAPIIIENLVNGLIESIPILVGAALQIINGLINFLTNEDNLNKLIASMSRCIDSIVDGLIIAIPMLVEGAMKIITKLVEFITTPGNMEKLVSCAVQIILKIAEGLIRALPTLISSAEELVTAINDTLTSINWFEVGADILAGIGKGLLKGSWGLAKTLGKELLGRVQWVFGIESPSKLFAKEVGPYLIQGIGVGADKEIPKFQKDMQRNISGMVSSFNVDEVTARMTAAVYQEQAATSRAMTSSYDRITANNSTITNNNDNGLNFNIENFNNNRNQDIRALTEEIEFYRKQIEIGGGKA